MKMLPAAVILPVLQAAPSAERSGSSTTWVLVVAAALFLAVWALRLRRRPGGAASKPGSFSDASELARDELERLLAEIQEVSREHVARLDTKIRLLNQLLVECDQKKKELEALLGHSAPPASTASASEVAKPFDSAPARLPQGRPANPLHEQVYSLQDSGKDLGEICAATGLEKGEVELILGLRRMPPK